MIFVRTSGREEGRGKGEGGEGEEKREGKREEIERGDREEGGGKREGRGLQISFLIEVEDPLSKVVHLSQNKSMSDIVSCLNEYKESVIPKNKIP